MDAVLISINPHWCNLIIIGLKGVELRKTRPKIKTPFKVYVYCTGGYVDPASPVATENMSKKVIGEFICNDIKCRTLANLIVKEDAKNTLSGTCLVKDDVLNYLNYKKGTPIYEHKPNCFYLWNISDFIIYNEPKELSEFSNKDKSGNIQTIKRPPQSWCYVEELKETL